MYSRPIGRYLTFFIFHNGSLPNSVCFVFNRLHLAILLADKTTGFFSALNFLLSIFVTPKRKKKIQYKEINYCIYRRRAFKKLNLFLSTKKFLKWTPVFSRYVFLKSVNVWKNLIFKKSNS